VKKSIAVLILVVVACAVYAPAARDGFVWDDTALILRDPLIRSWRLTTEGFNHFLFVDATPSDFYRPIQRLTYTLDYAAFAFRPAGYHLVSVLWHAAAAVALFFLAEELLLAFGIDQRKRRLISFFAALVWAIHPVQSAAVIYISGRADPLAATFGFLGCYLMLRQIRANGLAKLWFVLAAGVAFLLSAFSKESGLIFPILALAFFLLRKNWMDVAKTIAVTLFVCAIYWSLRSGAEHYPTPTLSAAPPPLVRPIIVARAVAEYTGLLILPINLHMDREVETQPAGLSATNLVGPAWRELQTLLGLIIIGAAIYWMLRSRRRNPPVFAGLLFAAITYLPISGIFSLNASVAEHWIYVPSAFVFLAAALEAAQLLETWRTRSTIRLAAAIIFAAWFIFLGVRTFDRTFDWKDERTFFQRTIASGGDSARMLINLGSLEMSDGKLEDAAVHFHAALQKKPDQPMAILNLGAIALKQNDFKLASTLLNRAAQMPPVDAQAYQLLAILENKQNKRVDLLRLRLAARTGAPNWSIEKRYIQVLDESGARSAAINELLECLRTQWYRAESWQLLSELETKAAHPDQAANALAMARAYDVHLEDHPTAP
jgi:tetratricopeptide (TPR) repeat protein